MISRIPYYLIGGAESALGIQVSDVQSRFRELLKQILPTNPIVWYGLEDVRIRLADELSKAKKQLGNDIFSVSLSGLYFPNADAELHCTRVSGVDAQSMGITRRPPSSDSLADQIEAIMNRAGARPIAVVDDTLFHGETIELLRKLGLRVDAAVEFIASDESCDKLTKLGIAVYPAICVTEYLDVMPLHDFLPSVPLCGKVVGTTQNNDIVPLMHDSRISYSLPYISPFVSEATVNKWASIPIKDVAEFSVFAIREARVIAARLEEQNILTLNDLANMQNLRVSIPYHGDNLKLTAQSTLFEIVGRWDHQAVSSDWF